MNIKIFPYLLLMAILIACVDGEEPTQPSNTENQERLDTNKEPSFTPPHTTSTDQCSTLEEATCESNPDCHILRGARFDLEARCFAPNLFVRCIPNEQICNNAVAVYKDPEGTCWRLAECLYDAQWETLYGSAGVEACPIDNDFTPCDE